jgi:TrmH RNA methyltransferase
LLAPALGTARAARLTVVGSDGHEGMPLDRFRWPPRSLLVLGAERDGMSEAVRRACDVVVRIAGSGAIESLNVGVAAGVLLAHQARARE